MNDLFNTGNTDENRAPTLRSLLETPTRVDVLRLNDADEDRYFSSNATLCHRKTAYEKLVVDEERFRDTSSELYFRIGSAVEDVVAQRFMDSGAYLDREVRIFDPDLRLSGRIDFVIKFQDEVALVELKTCGRLPTSPRKGHQAQLLSYMALTGINHGYVWYISRNVADWHTKLLHAPLKVTPSDTSLRAVLYNVALGRQYALQGAVPDKPAYMKKSHCGFCELKPVCWGDEDLPFPDSIPNPDEAAQRANDIVDVVMNKREERGKKFVAFYS